MNRITQHLLIGTSLFFLAVLAASPSFAQDNGEYTEDLPYTENYAGAFNVGSSPLRLWTQGGGFGQSDAHLSIGTRGTAPTLNGLFFFDIQYNITENSYFGGNVGAGYRVFHNNFFTGAPSIFGTSLWYDVGTTQNDNSFSQIGLSLESLSDDWDLRGNANFVVSDKMKQGSDIILGNEVIYNKNNLSVMTSIPTDYAYDVLEAELARRFMSTNFWIYAGGYQLNGSEQSGGGFKGGVRGYLWDDFLLQLGVSDDGIFDTNFNVGIVWTPGRLTTSRHAPLTVYDRLRDPVMRNNYVATRQAYTTGGRALTDSDSKQIHIVHVDSTATAPGDGSFESPLTNLDDVFANSKQRSIILLHSGSSHTGQGIVLRDEQRLLGEGNNVRHNVVTSERGTIKLPETSAGSLAGAVAVIQNAPTDAIRLTTGTNEVDDFRQIEISNLTIDGGARGIYSPGGVGDININQLTIKNTTGHGIELTPLVETLADSSTQVRFKTTLNDITFDNVGGDDIKLDANTTEPDSTPVVESISITDIASTDGSGRGINIINNKSAVTISNYTYDGGTTGTGGLLFTDSEGNVTATDIALSNGAGTGIEINNSDATFTFNETTITDTGAAAFRVDGGQANATFNGLISQSNNVAAVSVTGGHTGTINFNEKETDEGVIVATNGTGLQFNNADGTYRFNDKVELNGGDAGIDILADSSGTFNFTDTDITNASGAALNVNGSDAVVTLNGEIQNNAGRAVTLEANTGGTVTINSAITGTGTGILVKDNTGGTFVFAGNVDLNTGANTAVELDNNSDSTTRFQDLQIQTTTGTGLLATNTDAVELTGSNNTITTTTGTGVSFNGVTIGGSGVNLKSVSVDGAVNGISLVDVKGGAFNVGSGGSSPGDGGTIENTTGAGILLTNVANVSLNNISIESAGGDGISITHNNSDAHQVTIANTRITGSSAVGIDSTASGSGLYGLTVRDTTVDTTSDESIKLTFNDGVTTANVRMERVTAVNASGNEALSVTANGTTAKTLNILVDNSTFTNDDATAIAANFDANGAVNMNATITNNTFVNNDTATGKPFQISANHGAANVRLSLFDNISQVGTGNTSDEYYLIQNSGTISVEDWTETAPDDTASRNTGTINTTGTINNDTGSIPTPP